MTERPWDDPDPRPGDTHDVEVPGPEDGPVTAPPDEPPVTNDGDLDVGERAPGRARLHVNPSV